MTPSERLQRLADLGWITDPSRARCTELTGGVSSQILLIETDAKSFVVKSALPKLKTKDDWRADVSRGRFEREYFRVVDHILPGAVPRILGEDNATGMFMMEYLRDGVTWKERLLAETPADDVAGRLGTSLGIIHGRTWNDPAMAERFDTLNNFEQLRLDSYLRTTGRRWPTRQAEFEAEADRLASTKQCLVHGDFSPKNLLMVGDRLVILDAEVAWFGDPAFDLSFLINHLLLKSLWHASNPLGYHRARLEQARQFWQSYQSALTQETTLTATEFDDLAVRVGRLTPMLLLARVDGKSPVEYLSAPKQDYVRRWVDQGDLQEPTPILSVISQWWGDLKGADV